MTLMILTKEFNVEQHNLINVYKNTIILFNIVDGSSMKEETRSPNKVNLIFNQHQFLDYLSYRGA